MSPEALMRAARAAQLRALYLLVWSCALGVTFLVVDLPGVLPIGMLVLSSWLGARFHAMRVLFWRARLLHDKRGRQRDARTMRAESYALAYRAFSHTLRQMSEAGMFVVTPHTIERLADLQRAEVDRRARAS